MWLTNQKEKWLFQTIILEWNRTMYYTAIKFISAFNVKANFGIVFYKNITSHCPTNIETKPFKFYFLHGPMFFPMVLDHLFQGTYHYYRARYRYNHMVTLVVYHYNYIYKNCVAHNKQWLLLQHILTSIFRFFQNAPPIFEDTKHILYFDSSLSDTLIKGILIIMSRQLCTERLLNLLQ